MILFGGNGFIGRHLAVAAENRRPITIVARRKDSGFLSRFAPSAGFMYLEDFSGPAGDELIGSASSFVYLANTSIPASNIYVPWTEMSENVVPALQAFMRVGAINPHARVIFASSGGTIYGDEHARPISETSELRPISPYGLAKIYTEEALRYAARKTGVDYAILRISNPVGRWHADRGQGLVEAAVCVPSADRIRDT